MHRDQIARLLPTTYQLAARPGSPLDALLSVMEELHRPAEEVLDEVQVVIDPYRTPDAFVPWLTRWVDLDWVVAGADDETADPSGVELGRLRDLISIGHLLAQWRGTEVAVVLMLTTVTGVDGFRVEESPERPFHLVVTAPAAARPYEALIRRAIEVMKPAATTAELHIEQEGP